MASSIVKITWFLHACFRIDYRGSSLIIDPHDGGSIGEGIPAPPKGADYVLVTHEHYDHNAVSVVSDEHTVVVREEVGDFSLGPFRIRGVKLPHDEFNGRIRGYVVAYRIDAGEISVVHLSDLGRMLEEEEAKAIGKTDVVLLPAGGVYTLHPRQALDSAELLEAKIIIPMHYWIPGIHLPLEPLDTLLRYAKKWKVSRLNTNSIELSSEAMPKEKTIIVLAPPKEYKYYPTSF